MNSSSQLALYDKLQKHLDYDESYRNFTAYCIVIIPKTPRPLNIPFHPSERGTRRPERLIILAVRNDLDIPFIFPKEKDYTISLREALEDCPKSEGQEYPEKKKKIMELIPEGGYWRDLPEDLQKKYMGASYYLGGGKTGMARRLSWDEPSLTLTCAPAQKQTERCHQKETRPLSVREYARIQTFPDDWKFVGSTASQYKQIGNAVPVNLGYHIARGIIAMLDGIKEAIDMDVIPQSANPIDGNKEPLIAFATRS